MTDMVLGSPMEDVNDWNVEVALLFAKHAAPQASAFIKQRELEARRDDAALSVTQASEARQAAEAAHAHAESKLDEVEALPVRWGSEKVVVAGVGGLAMPGLLLLASVGFLSAAQGGAAVFGGVGAGLSLLLLVAGTVGFGWVFMQRRGEQRIRRADIDRATDLTDKTSGTLATAVETDDDARSCLADLITAIEHNRPAMGIRAFARVNYPLRLAKLGRHRVVLDCTTAGNSRPFKLAELGRHRALLEQVDAAVLDASRKPVLLRGDLSAQDAEGAEHSLDRLIGEEADLRQAIDRFKQIQADTPVWARDLPLVSADSGVTGVVVATKAVQNSSGIRSTTLAEPGAEAATEAVCSLDRVLGEMEQIKGDARTAIMESYGQMSQLLSEYRLLRTAAVSTLHDHVVDAMHQSGLLAVDLYCPRCNRVPAWLYRRLGIDPDTATEDDQEAIVARLRGDPEIAANLAKNPDLAQRFAGARRNLLTLRNELDKMRLRAEGADDSPGADLTDFEGPAERIRALSEQLEEVKKEYMAILGEIVTGSAQPVVELNRQARLQLDPWQHTWTCAACERTFADPDEIQCGRVLRVKEQLLMPMWNHLWTEKDDFRKSEIFRTNEALQRTAEKESEKLLAISEQYKADMRPVRENLIRLTGEADAKQTQLFDTLDGLEVMGLMTTDKATSVRARVEEMLGGELTSYKRQAEQKETLLAGEPQSQLARRQPAVDPIDLFRAPASLFQHSPAKPESVPVDWPPGADGEA